MDWKNLPGGGNIEDRRGGGGGGIPGGGVAVGGIGAVIIALIAMFFGIDPSSILGGGDSSAPVQTQPQQTQPQRQSQSQTQTQPQRQGTQPADETGAFVDRILVSTNDVWTKVFQASGKQYREPTLVLYSGRTQGGCGVAQSAVGPFYCPLDSKVYLDTGFFTQMKRQLGGGGDFAYAYVIAHEIGHHVQNELGIADQAERAQRSARDEAASNQISVRLELQADCFAGVWGNRSAQYTKITQTDVQQAINTATAIGDDNLQKQGRGYAVPDSFTHGTASQRIRWFTTGLKSGNASQCDTFAGNYGSL
ncbi:neutral zinc metallopeptidase [Deinococcus sp.]|uniref:KPN_02809 family neutral zinc metallopeptidase n=1 Tax=Deinococcus sp. TaxID=47478 RepID=UPI0025DC0FAF|nr:neutral zinc metallopeptidase [Deinococcus sp.]